MTALQSEHFEEFLPHTRLKHSILQYYLEAWVHKVGLGLRSPEQILMVDAFAGEGRDQVGNSGSPLRMARIAAIGEDRVTRIGKAPVKMRVVLVEKSPTRCRKLAERVSAFGDRVRVLRGTLGDHLSDILAQFANAPMFFFLDPFGIRGLDGQLIRKALDGATREVFLLIDDDGADRLARAATRLRSRRQHELSAQAAQSELFDDESWKSQLKEAALHSQASLERTGRAANEHLTKAFDGDEWRSIVQGQTTAERRDGLVRLFEQRLQSWGATYTTRIPIRSSVKSVKYVLIHGSQRPAGRQAMKEAVQRALGAASPEDGAFDAIRADCKVAVDKVALAVRDYYAGREAGWADKAPDSIRRFALRETEMFPWQLDELEDRLSSAGLRIPGRTKRFRFPAAP